MVETSISFVSQVRELVTCDYVSLRYYATHISMLVVQIKYGYESPRPREMERHVPLS